MYSYVVLALAAVAHANPILMARQGVVANIAPSAPAPPGCTGSVNYSFGVVANNISTPAMAKRQASQIIDGQIQAATASPVVKAISQIKDGQIQIATSAPKIMTVAPISMISDGQIQAGMHTMNIMPVAKPAVAPIALVSQISDGQIQAPAHPITQIKDGQIQAPATTTMMPVTESNDGQPVAPTMPAPTSAALAASQKTDGQPVVAKSSAVAMSSVSAAAPSAPSSSGSTSIVVCKSDFSVTLEGTKLTDQSGRTGYIASSFQLQFDNPPQAEAIYTSGFSICENGTLALGGSNIFYQCLSGNFYNVYDRKWAPQCSPAYIQTMRQVDC